MAAVAGKSFKDLLGGLVPYKGFRVLVPGLGPGFDIGGEFLDGAVRGALKFLGRERGEPPFDKVHPPVRDRVRPDKPIVPYPPDEQYRAQIRGIAKRLGDDSIDESAFVGEMRLAEVAFRRRNNYPESKPPEPNFQDALDEYEHICSNLEPLQESYQQLRFRGDTAVLAGDFRLAVETYVETLAVLNEIDTMKTEAMALMAEEIDRLQEGR